VQVERQIEQMVRFIKQEAEEKANEIKVSAEEVRAYALAAERRSRAVCAHAAMLHALPPSFHYKPPRYNNQTMQRQEFNLEKLQLLEQEKAKIRKDYERREGQVEVKKKIEHSKTLNEQRLRVLAARDAAIQGVTAEARDKVREAAANPAAYRKLLQALIVQAMRKLGEPAAVVRCRQADLPLVKEVVEPARAQYKTQYGDDAPALTVDSAAFLPPGPSGGKGGSGGDAAAACSGGVVLTSADGRIVCSNTLDDRVGIAYQANLPAIRAALFGTMAAGTH
jgi:V-type H+-transporting ATPase subunit E